MTGTITVSGIVLNSMMIGEYDRRLTILTKEKGKISVFAKGARKPNSAFLACSQPFTYAEFTLYEGRSSYNIMSVEKANYFAELRKDLMAVYYGMYFCELEDYLTREGNDELEQMKLLYVALLALEKKLISMELIRLIFELRAISVYGEAPYVFECVECHDAREKTGGWMFSSDRDGLVCNECRVKLSGAAFPISETARYTLQYIITSDIKRLFSFKINDDVLNEVEMVITRHRKKHIDREMKTMEVIRDIST